VRISVDELRIASAARILGDAGEMIGISGLPDFALALVAALPGSVASRSVVRALVDLDDAVALLDRELVEEASGLSRAAQEYSAAEWATAGALTSSGSSSALAP
jgi:hypothetical protein